MRYTGPSTTTEKDWWAKLGIYHFGCHVRDCRGMFDLRFLNLISFGVMLLAFVIAAAKSEHAIQKDSLNIVHQQVEAARQLYLLQNTKDK